MKKGLLMHVVLASLVLTGCDSDPTGSGPSANVRFFNAATGMSGNGGFTANGDFASGSALAFGQSACTTVDAGSTVFGFGAAGSGGLSGNALATLTNQTLIDGGNITVAAAGAAPTPTLFLLDNNFSGILGANQAAVRFVNLAPGTEANPVSFVVYVGAIETGISPYAINIAVGAPTEFTTVTSGSNPFAVLKIPGHDLVVTGSAGTFNLQPGTINTLAIVPNGADGFQLINLPRCT
ncbi:MAG TPA: DUF4397 domain-containing protein [Gemmatimonadaceae bacterium]